MGFDVIVIGGSFAGQAAALQLARARKQVLVIDAKRPRNRFAHSAYGFLGQDGESPSKIIEAASRQLLMYPSVSLIEDRVVDAIATEAGFQVTLNEGIQKQAKKLILATGVRDILPTLEGLKARWGVSVLHCPYCHGFELEQRPLGVLANLPNNALTFHQAMLVADWGPTTLFQQGLFMPTAEQKTALKKRGVRLEAEPIIELLGASPLLEGVKLADGRMIEISGLFTAPHTEPATDLAEKLGCEMTEGPTGFFVQTDERKQTSVPGVFSAGDVATPMGNAMLAAAAGVMAGSGVHASLVFE